MQFWVGNYSFPTNAVAVTSRTEVTRNRAGRPIRLKVIFDATATIFGDGQDDLTDREDEVRRVLAVPYQDMVLKQDSGANSGLALMGRNSLSGVVITSGPDFFEAESPEYVKTRQLRFSGEATFLAPNAAGAMVDFTETISVQGNGGPIRRWRTPLNARPIRYVVSPYSIIRYTQTGQATGHGAYPVPRPMFPRAFLMNESEAVQRQTPTPMGRAWVDYPVTWNYVYESDRLLVGVPQMPTNF